MAEGYGQTAANKAEAPHGKQRNPVQNASRFQSSTLVHPTSTDVRTDYPNADYEGKAGARVLDRHTQSIRLGQPKTAIRHPAG